jgi:translation initiation factor IF-2
VPQRGVTPAPPARSGVSLNDARRPRSLDHMGRPAPSVPSAPSPTSTAAAPSARPPVAARAGVPADEESEQKRVIRRPGLPLKIITPPKTPRRPAATAAAAASR